MVPCHLFLCILITGSFLFLNYYHGEHCLKIFEMTRESIPDNSVGKYRAEGGGGGGGGGLNVGLSLMLHTSMNRQEILANYRYLGRPKISIHMEIGLGSDAALMGTTNERENVVTQVA